MKNALCHCLVHKARTFIVYGCKLHLVLYIFMFFTFLTSVVVFPKGNIGGAAWYVGCVAYA